MRGERQRARGASRSARAGRAAARARGEPQRAHGGLAVGGESRYKFCIVVEGRPYVAIQLAEDCDTAQQRPATRHRSAATWRCAGATRHYESAA